MLVLLLRTRERNDHLEFCPAALFGILVLSLLWGRRKGVGEKGQGVE